MSRRLTYLVLVVSGLASAGVWAAVSAARGHSTAWAVAAVVALLLSAFGLLVVTRAIVIIERGERP